MKKIIIALSALFSSAFIFAKQLPNGVDVPLQKYEEENGVIVYAVPGVDTDIPTKYGVIKAKANSSITFYPDGALKSLFTDERYEVVTPAGKFVISSYSSSLQKNPVSFYQNGNLEQAYLPVLSAKIAKNYSADANVVNSPLGNEPVKQGKLISFYPDGKIHHFTVTKEYKITDSYIIPANTKVAFYHNGKFEEVSYSQEIPLNTIKIKAKTPVHYTEEGKISSLIPANNSYIKIGDDEYFFKSGEPVCYFESGKFKSFSINIADKDLTLKGINIFSKTEKEVINPYDSSSFAQPVKPSKIYLDCYFYENGNLMELSCKNENEMAFSSSIPTFILQLGNTFVRTEKIEFYENAAIKSYRIMPTVALKGDKENQAFYAGKFAFSPDQKTTASIGVEETKVNGNSFFDVSQPVIIFTDGTKQIEKISDDRLLMTSDVIWDENNKPVAYTALGDIGSEDSDKMIVKEIK